LTGRAAVGRTRATELVVVVLALAAVEALAACNGPSDTTAAVHFPATLMPLGVGTRWTYDVADSVIQSTDPRIPTSHTDLSFSVIGDTTGPSSSVWAVLDSSSGAVLDGATSGHNYLTNGPGGVLGLVGLPLPVSSPVVLLYLPYPPGGSAGPGFARTVVIVVYTRIATDSVITVPAGTFHCLVYVDASGGAVFATPGVGVVLRTSVPVTETDASGATLLQHQILYRLSAVDTTSAVSARRVR
jgi:hypothetical protein